VKDDSAPTASTSRLAHIEVIRKFFMRKKVKG
jgi:hypothetical protein